MHAFMSMYLYFMQICTKPDLSQTLSVPYLDTIETPDDGGGDV